METEISAAVWAHVAPERLYMFYEKNISDSSQIS